MSKCYEMVKRFREKYPSTVAFRIAKHCEVIDRHLNPGEEVIYAFAAQKNDTFFQIFNTNVVALTNKRIMIATKRVIWGYFFVSITPDMFNDLTIKQGPIWGKVIIDTVKEEVILSNIDRNALAEIDDKITMTMIEEKKEYGRDLETKKKDK